MVRCWSGVGQEQSVLLLRIGREETAGMSITRWGDISIMDRL